MVCAWCGHCVRIVCAVRTQCVRAACLLELALRACRVALQVLRDGELVTNGPPEAALASLSPIDISGADADSTATADVAAAAAASAADAVDADEEDDTSPAAAALRDDAAASQLVQAEARAGGRIRAATVRVYLAAVGTPLSALALLSLVGMQATRNGARRGAGPLPAAVA